jgi:hypothetical protein
MLGSAIYNAVATTVTDPKITARFLKGRTIYRLEPDAMPAAMPAEINEAAPE